MFIFELFITPDKCKQCCVEVGFLHEIVIGQQYQHCVGSPLWLLVSRQVYLPARYLGASQQWQLTGRVFMAAPGLEGLAPMP